MSHHNTNHIMIGRNPAATAVLCCVVSIIIQLVHSQQDNGCRTPDNGRGGCVSIHECAALLNILKSSKITPDQSKYLRSAQCKNGVGRMPYVCCREKAQPLVTEPRGEGGGQSLLPEPGICGAEPVGGRIFSGIETGIYEFPWFVLLEYVIGHRKTFACGGTLINQRYVLTAAHCLVGKEGRRKLATLRLGEYNTETEIDCIYRQKKNECADPPVLVGYEEIIIHENYQTSDRSSQNDIALIRLNRNIVFTDFIQPICLPKINYKSKVGEMLTAAGFGRTLKGNKSPVKLKIQLPVFDHQKCSQKFKTTLDIRITDNQICAGGRKIEDTCDSDSGGPLMYNDGFAWYLEGIVSVGNRCGLEGWPGVYTRVSSYVNWIHSKLR